MDYPALATSTDALLKSFGFQVKVIRAGTSVGSGYAVFTGGTAGNETASKSSLLAQTSVTKGSVLLLSGLTKEPMVNDTLVADKVTYLVVTVYVVRPSKTTLLYKVGVQ